MENAQVFGIPQPQIFVSERTPEGAELTQMDYEVYPQALEHVLRKVAEAFKGDLMVTENGIATAEDTRRVVYPTGTGGRTALHRRRHPGEGLLPLEPDG